MKLGTRSPVFLIICSLSGVGCQMLMLIVGCYCMPVVGVCLVVRCQLSSTLTVDCRASLSVVVVGCCLSDVVFRVLKVDCLCRLSLQKSKELHTRWQHFPARCNQRTDIYRVRTIN